MTFLNPLFLLAGAAALIPLVLHLFHRRQGRRVVFPALRYLLRTEREHARSIRLRQLLLLMVRMLVVLLLVLAGARLALAGRGEEHPPTALAVVIDNSLSTSRVVGEERVLDVLKARAREALERAGPEDRIWVLPAAEPWAVSLPGTPAEALARLESIGQTDAPADLPAALARARGLVVETELAAAEIHLLSDLQTTAFADSARTNPAGDVPVVIYRPPSPDSANHFIRTVTVGSGLPPLAGQRTEIAAELASDRPPTEGAESGGSRAEAGDAQSEGSTAGAGDDVSDAGSAGALPVRIVIAGRVRAAGSARTGDILVLPAGPFPGGAVEGWVETDPDALGADNRHFFSFRVRPPIPVRREGGEAFFLDQALAVLDSAGRLTAEPGEETTVLVSVAGAGLVEAGGGSTIVVPPADPALLPALNRRLAEAGIPWRYEAPTGSGETVLDEVRIPVELEEIAVRRQYRMRADADAPPQGEVLAQTADGSPFLVSGREAQGAWLLLAAPADPRWTDLPVSAGMVPLLEWAISRWAMGGAAEVAVHAGQPISTPAAGTAVRDPSGVDHPLDAARTFHRTGRAGLYRILAGDSVLGTVPVNPPSRESFLGTLPDEELRAAVGRNVVTVDDPQAWRRSLFRSRRGSELWRPLLLAAFALLLLEGGLAAAGGPRGQAERGRKGEPLDVSG